MTFKFVFHYLVFIYLFVYLLQIYIWKLFGYGYGLNKTNRKTGLDRVRWHVSFPKFLQHTNKFQFYQNYVLLTFCKINFYIKKISVFILKYINKVKHVWMINIKIIKRVFPKCLIFVGYKVCTDFIVKKSNVHFYNEKLVKKRILSEKLFLILCKINLLLRYPK